MPLVHAVPVINTPTSQGVVIFITLSDTAGQEKIMGSLHPHNESGDTCAAPYFACMAADISPTVPVVGVNRVVSIRHFSSHAGFRR